MKRISRKRFDAYVDFSRNPLVFGFSEEIRWYENESKTLFGVIALDYTDRDYTAIILGRDEIGRIRCFNLQISFSDIEKAEYWLFESVNRLEESGEFAFPQGDQRKKCDLFKPVVDVSRMDTSFNLLNTHPTHMAAKSLISEIMPHFFDIDGNFVEQFQTNGFDSRLWELYLFCYFNEEQLIINRDYFAPDFFLSDGTVEVGVEAVIVGRKTNNISYDQKSKFDLNVKEELVNRMPIKFGSPLYSKLTHTNKKTGAHYWDYSHTKGKPFVIAIADFHGDHSMTWSHPALLTYLYGYTYSHTYDENGNLIVIPKKVERHIDGTKDIPSGFFFQENAENISAILTSTSGTISKFSRIGKQCGFDENNITMIRYGTCYDHDPNASEPQIFKYLVTEECNETWGEGVSIYHNPVAKYPLSTDYFQNAAQFFFKDGFIISQMPEFFPYASFTDLIMRKGNN